MKRNNLVRGIIVLVFVVAAVWMLIPSFQLQSLSDQERAEMPREALNKLYTKAIHLGLDLKGGMHMVLEINHKGLAKSLDKDPTELKDKELSDATDRALEIIRNRVDQYGVAEPSIQKQGNDRIVVQLPGVDRERARGLIGTTAMLEFKLVQDEKVTQEVVDKIDKVLAAKSDKKQLDSTLTGDKPFSGLLTSVGRSLAVLEADKDLVEKTLKNPEVVAVVPADYEFAWGEKVDREGFRGYNLYLLKKDAEITGAALADARMSVGTKDNPGGLNVEFTLVRKAANIFSRVTAANIKRQLAIVLDGAVVSAPEIRDRIPSGRGVIEMGSGGTPDEARDLAIILRAGALPAPVDIIEERSVGPSLGQDSINSGIRATLIGGILTVLFMVIYYSLSGLIASIGLAFNILMLLAIMAAFRFTLTLPGLAGIALTAGMAVDANVLIFERVREELRLGKTIRASIDAGYDRAFTTILDSHVTTMAIAIVLWIFGTGTVKGFAVTLFWGLLLSMFTSLVITHLIFDWITEKWNLQKLPV
ncbi:MAG TPA: protein translocase subunit SecD [Candidatus Edwardsbacteria bacterium]|nr:protein translocase subunit SecD [Candidatus Edwardsbacteria bacterium]